MEDELKKNKKMEDDLNKKMKMEDDLIFCMASQVFFCISHLVGLK